MSASRDGARPTLNKAAPTQPGRPARVPQPRERQQTVDGAAGGAAATGPQQQAGAEATDLGMLSTWRKKLVLVELGK